MCNIFVALNGFQGFPPSLYIFYLILKQANKAKSPVMRMEGDSTLISLMKKRRLEKDFISPHVTELIHNDQSCDEKLRVIPAGTASPLYRCCMVFQKGQTDKMEVVSSDCRKVQLIIAKMY